MRWRREEVGITSALGLLWRRNFTRVRSWNLTSQSGERGCGCIDKWYRLPILSEGFCFFFHSFISSFFAFYTRFEQASELSKRSLSTLCCCVLFQVSATRVQHLTCLLHGILAQHASAYSQPTQIQYPESVLAIFEPRINTVYIDWSSWRKRPLVFLFSLLAQRDHTHHCPS